MLSTAVSVTYFLLLFFAAWFDARRRRFPNRLAVVCAIAALLFVWTAGDIRLVGARILVATAICVVLLLLELIWRRFRCSPGLGLGDIKALFSLVVYRPVAGVASFGLSLVLLAAACALIRSRSLPLLPFLVPVFSLMCIFGFGVA